MESRTQGSKAKAKDSLSEDRHSRGQGQECSRPRPRTQAQVLSKKKKRFSQKFFRRSPNKKKVFTKIFQAISTKKRFPKNFPTLHKILTIQKIVLSSSRGQANFRGLEASRPRTSKCVLEDSTSATLYCNNMRKRGCKSRLCKCNSSSWLSFVLQLKLLPQCCYAYFTANVSLVWYWLLAHRKLLDLSLSIVTQKRLVLGQ